MQIGNKEFFESCETQSRSKVVLLSFGWFRITKQNYIEIQMSNSPFGHIDSPKRPTRFRIQNRVFKT